LPAGRKRKPDAAGRSGARPDARDPQTIGSALDRLITDRGWEVPVAVGGVIGRWNAVVGPDLSGHCLPLSFDEGVLTVQAESTAWATQVRLLLPTLMRRLEEEAGEGTVRKVIVHGPTVPSWRRGARVAPGGQGPRDTYG
jgi:predicted nucleic acid-binding Zn ribbon protein